MKPDMKEYFEVYKFDENVFEDIAKGKWEPQKNVDYQMWTPSMLGTARTNDSVEVLREEVKESLKNSKTYKGSFGIDNGQELHENCLNICTSRASQKPEDDEVDLIQTFNEALRTESDVKPLPQNEILQRLSNPNVLSNMEHFKKLPGGIQKFMEQFPYFKEKLFNSNVPPSPQASQHSEEQFNEPNISELQVSEASSDKENSNASMSVPNNSSSTPLSDTSNKAVADRVTRSSVSESPSVQAKRDLVRSQMPTPSRVPRSKGLVKNPSTNRRMELFTQKFSTQKRRRDSTSPPSGSQ